MGKEEVRVLENGKLIGKLCPTKFMKSLHVQFGSTLFLSEYIALFNECKAIHGESTRVEVRLIKR